MVATTLLLTLVTLGAPSALSKRSAASMSRPISATSHLVVPFGVAVPIAQGGPRAASGLFKRTAPSESASPVVLERFTTRHAADEPALSVPSDTRPSCSL